VLLAKFKLTKLVHRKRLESYQICLFFAFRGRFGSPVEQSPGKVQEPVGSFSAKYRMEENGWNWKLNWHKLPDI